MRVPFLKQLFRQEYGLVAQLGERRVRIAEVEGSIPFESTMALPPRHTLPAPLERGGLTFV